LIARNSAASPNDFIQYYIGARNLAQTGDPYSRTGQELGLETAMQNCYPPLISYLCLPLAWVSLSTASQIWSGTNLILTGVLAWQLIVVLRPGSGPNWRCWVLALAFLMCYPPQLTGTSLGQVHTLVAVLICGAYLCAQSEAERWAGLLLGCAALLKVFPCFLILAFLLAGRRRTALIAVSVCVIFLCLTFDEHREYVQRYVMKGYYPIAAQCFVSIPAMATRLFVENPYAVAAIRSEFLSKGVLVAGFAAASLGLSWLLFQRPRGELIIAAFICAMLLLTPPSGYYHLNLALLAAALHDRAGRGPIDERTESRETRSLDFNKLSILCLILTAIPVEYGLTHADSGITKNFYNLIHTGWGALLLTPGSYGLALLFVMCCNRAGGRVSRAAGFSSMLGAEPLCTLESRIFPAGIERSPTNP
jgi:hypothetical protein